MAISLPSRKTLTIGTKCLRNHKPRVDSSRATNCAQTRSVSRAGATTPHGTRQSSGSMSHGIGNPQS
eukprot:11219742-Lingulodinium_polyedra.AAC.1